MVKKNNPEMGYWEALEVASEVLAGRIREFEKGNDAVPDELIRAQRTIQQHFTNPHMNSIDKDEVKTLQELHDTRKTARKHLLKRIREELKVRGYREKPASEVVAGLNIWAPEHDDARLCIDKVMRGYGAETPDKCIIAAAKLLLGGGLG